MSLKHDLLSAFDPVVFSRSLSVEPDPWQAEVLRYEGKRLLLNCSRQSGKSTTTAILALHRALYHPNALILLASPSQRQSQELFRKVRRFYDVVETPLPLLEDNKLSLTLSNNSRIISLPADQSTVRGFSGVDLILEDESAQVDDEFHLAVLPMLITSNGVMICMSTPYGKTGHFFEAWTSGGSEWGRIQITADMCPRISPEQLEAQRRSMGDMFFRQEYLCEFVETSDVTFKYDLIERAFSDEIQPLFGSDGNAE